MMAGDDGGAPVGRAGPDGRGRRSVVEVLADRTAVQIRPIGPDDIDDLVAFHEGLSFQTIYRRFFGGHPHLGSAEARHFCVLDEPGRFALVAHVDRRIVGVARMEPSEVATTAEVAFVIADDFQRRGLGRILAQRLATIAAERGITDLVADVLSDNRPMLRLLPAAGLPVTVTHSHGVARVSSHLPPPGARL
jgi:RimJ/RimL family protein N-acetyltransferase